MAARNSRSGTPRSIGVRPGRCGWHIWLDVRIACSGGTLASGRMSWSRPDEVWRAGSAGTRVMLLLKFRSLNVWSVAGIQQFIWRRTIWSATISRDQHTGDSGAVRLKKSVRQEHSCGRPGDYR